MFGIKSEKGRKSHGFYSTKAGDSSVDCQSSIVEGLEMRAPIFPFKDIERSRNSYEAFQWTRS